MKKRILILLIVPVLGAIACQREIVEQFPKPTDVVNPNPPVPPTEYKYGLAELGAKVGLKVGTAVTRDEYFKNDSVEVILKRDFVAATMGNEMKHSSIVQANGNLNFKTADELYGWINSCGNAVYGHTLGWHSQQNTAYLNGLIEKADDENAASLLQENWRFESGSLEPFGGTVTVTSAPRETFAGQYSVKAASDGATLITPAVNSDAEAYALSFWAKGTGDVKVDMSDGKTATVTLEEGWKKYTVSEKVNDGTDYTYTITLPEGTVVDNVRVCQTTIEEEEETKDNYINPYTLVEGGDFETFELGAVGQNGWGVYNGGDYMSIVDTPTHSGARAMKLDNSTGVAANPWDIQVAAPTVNVEVGKTYRIAWYVKASEEADMQIDVRGYTSGTQYFSSQYSQFTKPNEEWQYSFLDVTPDENGDGTLTVVFYGGTAPVTYYIDDFQIFPVKAAEAVKTASRGYGKYADINYVRPAAGAGHVRLATVESGTKFDGEPVYDCLDFAYKKFVYGMIEHYDVYGWDVMNEVFTDNGVWRSGENTTGDNIFIWGDYLGGSKAFTERAFAYAKDALDLYGKSADLYINDYNLEYSSSKLSSICDFVKNNPNVDGIGSQMHIQSTTDLDKIKAMLEAMVATGKLVRISELDITFDSNAGGIEQDQIDRYVYVFDQYLTLVPEAQRGGISIWGINDKDSWLGEDKAPLLYKGKKYERKPAYEALYKYLLEKAGME